MTPNSQITIPIEHAFDVWKYYKATGNTPTEAEIEEGKVLNLSSVNDLKGKLSTKIIWQEDQNDANRPIISDIFIDKADKMEGARLVVETGSELGNALVAVHIGETGNPENDPVLWQWHIWIPEGEPKALATIDGTWTFMDRYLGAINNVPTDYNELDPTTRDAHGLYYQWGRPTPIKKFGAVETIPAAINAEQTNLAKALQSAYFILPGGNSISNDWYSNNKDSNLWINRWGNTTVAKYISSKTLLDPCPSGWRVPAWKENKNPWTMLMDSADKGLKVPFQGFHFKPSGYNYYAASSSRNYQNEGRTPTNVGSSAFIWSASSHPNSLSIPYLTFSGTNYLFDKNTHFPTMGMAVRCVKE